MKFFYQTLSVISVTVGSIVGAGFISGRELVSFFGTESFILPLSISFIILSGCLLLLFGLGKNSNGLIELNSKLLKSPKPFNVAVLISSFISVCGIFAGLDGVYTLSIGQIKFPILSISVLVLVSFTSAYGIKGVERVSLILIPLVIVAVFFMVFRSGSFDYGNSFIGGGISIFNTFLYCFMNCFINLPAIIDVAKGKGKTALIISAIISSLLLSVMAMFILASISFGKTENAQMPLYEAVGGVYAGLFAGVLLSALITSALSAYYPLYSFAKKKLREKGIIIMAVCCFIFSRLGLKNIVNYAYPIIGVFGGVYLAICLVYKIKNRRLNKNFSKGR